MQTHRQQGLSKALRQQGLSKALWPVCHHPCHHIPFESLNCDWWWFIFCHLAKGKQRCLADAAGAGWMASAMERSWTHQVEEGTVFVALIGLIMPDSKRRQRTSYTNCFIAFDLPWNLKWIPQLYNNSISGSRPKKAPKARDGSGDWRDWGGNVICRPIFHIWRVQPAQFFKFLTSIASRDSAETWAYGRQSVITWL